MAPSEVTSSDRDRWRDCAASALEPNPFLEPDWLLPALTYLDDGGDTTLLVVEEGSQLHALIPLGTAESRPLHSILNTRVVPKAVPIGTPLVRASHGPDALTCLEAEIRRQVVLRASDLVVYEWLVEGGAVATLMKQSTRPSGDRLLQFDSWERGFLRRQADDDEYWLRGIGKDRLRRIRKHDRRLCDALDGQPDLRLRTDFAAIEEFLRLEMSGWKGHRPQGEAFGRRSSTAGFFRTVCRNYLESGRMGFLSLGGAEGAIAMLCLIQAGEGMFAFRTAYDERFAAFGPGVLLWLRAMELFHRETGAEWLDTCAEPGNQHLLRLFPDRRVIATLIGRVAREPAPTS